MGNAQIIRRGSEGYYQIDDSKYRPEFSFDYNDNVNNAYIKITKIPKLQFHYVNVNEEKAIQYSDVIYFNIN